jgi:hypothetical protein
MQHNKWAKKELSVNNQPQGYQNSGFHPETPGFGLNLRAQGFISISQGLDKKLTKPE